VADIENFAIRHLARMRSANDVDVVGNCQLLHELNETRRIVRYLRDRIDGAERAFRQRQQLQCQHFREDYEVGLIV
jgi:hypothetical protein